MITKGSLGMSIGKAWCVELDDLFDIIQIYNIYHGTPGDSKHHDYEGKDLTFVCPNEDCRTMVVKPKITAVNYYKKHLKAREQPYHFRVNDLSKNEHADNCRFADREMTTNELKKEGLMNSDNECAIDPETNDNIVSIFEPATKEHDLDDWGLATTVEEAINRLPTRRIRVDTNKRALRTKPIRTKRLHHVVSQFEALGTHLTRESTPLQLITNSPYDNYSTCFNLFKNYQLGSDQHHIFHGAVSVTPKYYNKDIVSGVVIRFYDSCPLNNNEYRGSFYLSMTKLKSYIYPSNTLKLIETAINNPKLKNTLYCYFYGRVFLETIKIRDEDKVVLNINIDHLHNLVFRKKRPTN